MSNLELANLIVETVLTDLGNRPGIAEAIQIPSGYQPGWLVDILTGKVKALLDQRTESRHRIEDKQWVGTSVFDDKETTP